MSRERKTDPVQQISKGIEQHFGQAFLAFGVASAVEIAAAVKMVQGDFEQAMSLIMVTSVLSGASLYHFYKEGEIKENQQK